MCGIWALLKQAGYDTSEEARNSFQQICRRGPDNKVFQSFYDKMTLGFHRLAIMDPSHDGDQPFFLDHEQKKLACICNGEIYNFKEIIAEEGFPVFSESDCEVLLHLYVKYGQEMVDHLDGVFAFLIVIYDEETQETELFCARDRIGVRPMFYAQDGDKLGFCSEIKGLVGLFPQVQQFPPGHFLTFKNEQLTFTPYYQFEYPVLEDSEEEIKNQIRLRFTDAVRKRIHADRPLCCLLSGGKDSSMVCAVMANVLKEMGKDPSELKTYSIGMEEATDKIYAQMVADHIGSDHTFIQFTVQEGLEAIRNVIHATETYDVTTIRASVGQHLISKWISENTDYKVILNGDGADEVEMGYQYFHDAPSPEAADEDSVRLVREIHMYDVIRVDRNISYYGLEARVPFLDTSFVDYYLSIPASLRVPRAGPDGNVTEKFLFRQAFADTGVLPDEVLWRPKEAFSDGVSGHKKAWFEIIQEYIDEQVTDEEFDQERHKYKHCTPATKEAYYYRKMFDDMFGDQNCHVIPHIWLPMWQGDIQEPSARVLQIYQQRSEKDINLKVDS